METCTLQIPFIHYDKKGIIEVKYEENSMPAQSGCDILIKQFNLCKNMFSGYPTMHAYFKEYEGFGISKYSGWIQIISFELYPSANSDVPDEIITQVDVTPNMRDKGLPFFAYGYPAEIYDPPCNNYTECPKLRWKANTFLVSMPSFINDEKIEYIAGFSWGYIDYHSEANHSTKILPLVSVNADCWNSYLELLTHDFPQWNFTKS